MLQWGRNFIVAEMNQAADYMSEGNWLQWGRNFIVAEMSQRRRLPDANPKASMGPQLYRCGNMITLQFAVL